MEWKITDLIDRTQMPCSPGVGFLQAGITINASDLAYTENTLSFELHVSYMFPQCFTDRFSSVAEAVLIIFEDAASGTCAATRCVDPYLIDSIYEGPTYLGPGPDESDINHEQFETFQGGFINIPFSVKASSNQIIGSSFFARACLHEYFSNTLAFNLNNEVTFKSLPSVQIESD